MTELSTQQQLKIQQGIRLAEDDLVLWIQDALDNRNSYGKLEESQFRNLLRAINTKFYHQTITSNQIERFIIEETGIPLEKVFDQYLRSPKIPTLEIQSKDEGVQYRWTNCVSGFTMKVKNSRGHWISPTEEWSSKVIWQADFGEQVFDSLFYIKQSHIRE
jgi:hypothetical protein